MLSEGQGVSQGLGHQEISQPPILCHLRIGNKPLERPGSHITHDQHAGCLHRCLLIEEIRKRAVERLPSNHKLGAPATYLACSAMGGNISLMFSLRHGSVAAAQGRQVIECLSQSEGGSYGRQSWSP